MTSEITIERLAHGGDGVGYIDGKICFVPYGLPQDKLSVEITEDGKRFSRAEIVAVLEASPYRIDADCPAFGSCGGCTWLHFAYPAQMEWKQKLVEESFRRLAKVEVSVDGLGDPDLHKGYRTRATFRGDKKNRGFYAAQSHDVIDIEECPLCDPAVNAALTKIRETGADGNVEVVVNPEGEEVFVWTEKPSRLIKKAFDIAECPGDTEKQSTFVFDDTPVVNGTFNQSSLKLNRILVEHVHSFLEGADSILDLYCGSGNLTMALSDRAKVIGLDRDGPSIKAADIAERGEFHIGKQKDFHDFIHRQHWGAIVLDPPRVGAKSIMKSLSDAKAAKIIYVSCDHATQARDVTVLLKAAWKITSLTAIDLFPNTSHVESVCILERS
ncbi:MAG: class I SAM-dependent RNA methyltransferase [Candidatus Hydrogenedentota bacterium]